MSDVVIRAEGLGKRYLISHQSAERERYTALRDVLGRSLKGLGRSTLDMLLGRQIVSGDDIEEFWALKNVSFEIKRGDVVGVLGRNGAGKSTLLKILSRITEPSTGRVTIKGRLSSLLEVGTGFHPELTGRENVYLNGSILGMKRSEIRAKFDQIVEFAEIQKFLDTPVKRYSSGMYVRLAFAVAAHLEPEILVVDEVLAVGDAEFQKKCLGKMNDVSNSGRTVIFVSHNLTALRNICPTSILLSRGHLIERGPTEVVIRQLIGENASSHFYKGDRFQVTAQVCECMHLGRPASILQFSIEIRGPLDEPHFGLGISDQQGNRVATIFSDTFGRLPTLSSADQLRLTIESEPIRLTPGAYNIKTSLSDRAENVEVRDDAVRINIPEYSPFQSTLPLLAKPTGMLLLPIQRMEFERC